MDRTRQYLVHLAIGVLAGLAASMSLVALWHLLGLASSTVHDRSGDYRFSEYLARCLSVSFAVAYTLTASGLGWLSRGRGPGFSGVGMRRLLTLVSDIHPIVFGMVLPLPLAMVIEGILEPTSHNLLPFEVVLYWFPTFLIALCGAAGGWLIRTLLAGNKAGTR
jgi:hypothetical protein